MGAQAHHDRGIEIFRKHGGIMRMAEAVRAGLSRRALYKMRDDGVVERLSRGLYRLASLPDLSAPDLVAVAARIPKGVICLISALAFHELTTVVPHAVDVAVARGTEMPRVDYPPVNVYWFSGQALTSGIEQPVLDGKPVRIYSAEKSIADAFKYRNKIGLEVAVEALRTWRERSTTNLDGLVGYARLCKVERVMRPYLHAAL